EPHRCGPDLCSVLLELLLPASPFNGDLTTCSPLVLFDPVALDAKGLRRRLDPGKLIHQGDSVPVDLAEAGRNDLLRLQHACGFCVL
ncbi:MAG: hypothetical protein ACXWYI_05130, partial [Actinomycetota bacterium]